MISLITALLSIDAAAVSIHNIASRLNEKQVQNLRPHLPDNKAQMKLHPHPFPFHEKYNSAKPYAYAVPPPESNKAMASYSYPMSPKNNPESTYHRSYPFYSQNKPTYTGDFAHPFLVPSPQNHPMISNLFPPETSPRPIPFPFSFPFSLAAFNPNNHKKVSYPFPEVELYPSSEHESEVEFSHSSDNVTEMEAYPSLEDEVEKELDSSAEDEIEKENSSENETQKKSSPDEVNARTSQTPCLVGWIYNRDLSTCYSYYQTKMNWIQAEISCQMYAPGGHLASIHWEEHNQFIQDLIKRNNPAQTSTWIGLNDCHKEGVYLWTDGSATDFTKWNHDQPEDKEEMDTCVNINSEGIGGTWDNRVCSDELPFVCAYKLL
ncbi:macrophage mannose receptor 1-like isoform X2 [Pristis pectinata]|uniref:macrophage mannose receptor 1-like isoform X2 n=1 Tax=Pristis pectinata TaxID=685728 RepID=UPI00223D2643|nr:macrophage mannose receptor 1-like isoform X2 [Pristis pectinata]XP_051886487.1 macrophage mannose receptor 1-like isoform X2 [Pristis pectinata]